MKYRVIIALVLAGALQILAAESVTVVKPVYTEIYLRSNPAVKISGSLLRYDDDSFVIKVSSGQRELRWLDLTGVSAFTLRARLIDRKNPQEWLKLGDLTWSLGAEAQAQRAFDEAIKLDASTRSRVKEIQAIPAGSTIKAAAPTTNASISDTKGPETLVKYVKPTPQQDAAAIERAQTVAKAVEEDLKLHFKELQTTHFIIFTDWDPQEYNFLKVNVEEAYAAVSGQFNIPVKDNIFVGKLPVFMFAMQTDFQKFATDYDSTAASDTLQGYYSAHSDGTGHMAMWKPDIAKFSGDLKKAQERWAYTLTHEFTHAFVNRYRSNARIPRWMNEGLAEVIAQSVFPRPETHGYARNMAARAGAGIEFIFDDEQMPSGEYYPVMQTMVEMLIAKDTPRFIRMFNAIKDGSKPEQALKDFYGVDNAGLLQTWKEFIQRH